MFNTHVFKLRLGRFGNPLSIHTSLLPVTEHAPFFVVDSNSDGQGETPFPLDVRNFNDEFLSMMDYCYVDNLFPCSFWIVKWGTRYGMAAASRQAHPNAELFYVINGQAQTIEYIERWNHQRGHNHAGMERFGRDIGT